MTRQSPQITGGDDYNTAKVGAYNTHHSKIGEKFWKIYFKAKNSISTREKDVPFTIQNSQLNECFTLVRIILGMALCVAHMVAQMQMKQIDDVIEITRENARKFYGV